MKWSLTAAAMAAVLMAGALPAEAAKKKVDARGAYAAQHSGSTAGRKRQQKTLPRVCSVGGYGSPGLFAAQERLGCFGRRR